MFEDSEFEADLQRFLEALVRRGGPADASETGRPLGLSGGRLTRLRHELLRRQLVRPLAPGEILELTPAGIKATQGKGRR